MATTGTVTGTVSDKTGAVVSNARVELRDLGTNLTRSVKTSQAGQFSFFSVSPGTYRMTILAPGFRQSVISDLRVAVGRSTLADANLEVGAATEFVEVRAGTGSELQTLDSSVGNVIDERTLADVPSLGRNATALLLLQPLAVPAFNETQFTGGQVAGARTDQNTFMVDGGDATSNTEGTGGYALGFDATPKASIPTPVESLEEFRVVTNNQTASFTRSAGGEVQMVTRRGTNNWHGAGYWYRHTDALDANTWTRNSLNQKNPPLKDNRLGGRIGGPISKDRTFLFLNYQGERFPQSGDVTRIVPTTSLASGILEFKDATGTVRAYPIPRFDPRRDASGLDPATGLNSVIKSLWGELPPGNDTTRGDGLNTIGFSAPGKFSLREDFAVGRLDHKISEKWQFISSYRWDRITSPALNQFDIGGVAPGCSGKQGVPCATADNPVAPRYLVLGLTGALTQNITNDFRFDWLRYWWEYARVKPFPQVPGTAAALEISNGAGPTAETPQAMDPMNVNTIDSRSRAWNGGDYTFIDNISWLKGAHMIQFGGRFTRQSFFHRRDDKVVGLTSPVYLVDANSSDVRIGSAFRPPTCGAGVTTFCLASGDVNRWNQLYAAALGIVSRGTQLLTLNGQLQPNPPGTPLLANTIVNDYQLYASDTWRIRPSLTISYGLAWSYQTPPFEEGGRQTILFDDAGQRVDFRTYLDRKQAAALQGNIYNPTLNLLPIRQTKYKYPYDPDRLNFAPRVAAAWNPSFTSGLLRSLFGNRKSVFRAGWGRNFERINAAGIVMIPLIGAGFGTVVSCRGPRVGGSTCRRGSDPTNAFRIGVDGSTVPIPSLTSPAPPIIPGTNSRYEIFDFRLDPKRKIGRTDTIDITIQRELSGNMLLEAGYVGRLSRHLYQGFDLAQVPYMLTKGGQQFLQAFQNIAVALRNRQTPAPQQFFEALGGTGYTATVVAGEDPGNFINNNLTTVWNDWVDSFYANATTPITNQFDSIYLIGDAGYANYHAGFLTLRKRLSHGLTFDVNYTLSKSLDTIGGPQFFLNAASDAFNLNRDYGPSGFDRWHTLNVIASYDLPFGRGRRWSASNVLDRIISGWNFAGIYTYGTGLPLNLFNGADCGETWGAGDCNFATNSGLEPVRSLDVLHATRHNGVTGSNGFGTNGTINAFADPAAVAASFRDVLPFSDARGGWGTVRSLGRWNFNFAVNKSLAITERVRVGFSAQFFNLFNHPLFNDPSLDISNPPSFGVLNRQYNKPRQVQLGLRVDF